MATPSPALIFLETIWATELTLAKIKMVIIANANPRKLKTSTGG